MVIKAALISRPAVWGAARIIIARHGWPLPLAQN